jgi:hypothetical protein
MLETRAAVSAIRADICIEALPDTISDRAWLHVNELTREDEVSTAKPEKCSEMRGEVV